MKLTRLARIFALPTALALTTFAAHADTFDWSLTAPAASLGGFPELGSGTLTATLSGGDWTITSISGTFGATTITGLSGFDGAGSVAGAKPPRTRPTPVVEEPVKGRKARAAAKRGATPADPRSMTLKTTATVKPSTTKPPEE